MKSKIFYVIIFMMNLNIADAQNEDEPGKSLPGNWDLSLTAGFTQSINSDIPDRELHTALISAYLSEKQGCF
jgi:hypothetical protein